MRERHYIKTLQKSFLSLYLLSLKNKILIFFFPFYLFLFSFYACNTTEPGGDNGNDGQDTTSHDFTFETWKFGEHSSSILYDVAIIDENNIYATGEIYLNDSLGQPDPHPYGLIHWDGNKWECKRIVVKNPSGGYSYVIPTGIFAIDSVNIWLVRGGVFLFDGKSIKRSFWLVNYSGYNGGIFDNGEIPKKIGGSSSNDLFVIGDKGALAYFNGSGWQKIDSGTELDINDIWGCKTTSGEYEILCIASDKFTNNGKKILKIENNKVTSINNEGLSNSLNTVWFVPDKKYFVGGDGLFSTQNLNTNWIKNTELPAYYKTSIRGNDTNDIIVSGAFGLLLHYNGKNWINFQNLTYINGAFARVDIKGNIVCAVGSSDNQAVIVIGKR